jgi:hypothetical protein
MENEVVSGKLAQALARAQGEFGLVPKNKIAKIKTKTGAEYQYKYADLADVLRMALPILAKNEIAFTQPLIRKDGHLTITTRLSHSSGEYQQSDGIILPEGLSPQEFGSVLSYMRRYDGTSMLGISPDEDTDGQLAEAASAPARRARPAQEPQAPAPPKPPDSMSQGSGPAVISDAQRRRLFAVCKEYQINVDALKDHIFKEYGFVSTKDILKSKYDEIVTWLDGGTK